ncbi:hypothetical protein G6011_06703 [Alternaria panax]|uniref:RING-type domain-containing protein n=1 Tax=Alternaria panax TaxID=48097 RepID=A0AAD4FGY0_9PLEO|nr:hypothetical protein G6011_06703 [Alternaria panax]
MSADVPIPSGILSELLALESCAIADLWEYYRRQDVKWEMQDVYADEFHYANQNKDVVCRCLEPWNHDHGTPRNLEIVEQCAEFFCVYTGELTATREQWKCFDYNSHPSYSSVVQDRPGHMASSQDTKKHRSSLSRKVEVRSKAERIASFIPSPCHSASTPEPTPESQPEMPPGVWERARSSICKSQLGVESAFGTPMGTVPPSRSTSPPVTPNMARLASNSTQVQREADVSESKDPSDTLRARDWLAESVFSASSIHAAYEQKAIRALLKRFPHVQIPKTQATRIVPHSYGDEASHRSSVADPMGEDPISNHPSRIYEEEDHESASNRSYSPFDNDLWYRDRLHYQTYGNMANQIPVAELPARGSSVELPACRSPVELPATAARQRHTATLKELEGRNWDTASELEGRNARIWHEQAISGTFNHARKTAGLSSLFEQILDIATYSLLSQEDFLLRHAVASSSMDLARAEDCQLCSEPSQDVRGEIIMLPDCGHHLHESCLLHDLRKRDQQFGRCPVYHLIFCERTLIDRIGTDTEAIFGLQVTSLKVEVSIEFQRRSEVVTCCSEEGVAVA